MTEPTAHRRVDLQQFKVVLLLDSFRVEGVLHVDPRIKRSSEVWEAVLRDRRKFQPMTEVTITSHDGGHVIAKADFMMIDKDEVKAVQPVEG